MLKNDIMINNENNRLEIEVLKEKKQYYVNELEKAKDLGDDTEELMDKACLALAVGVLFLGATVFNGVNTFSDDFNPFYAIATLASGFVGAYCTFNGFKILIRTMSMLSAYIIGMDNIYQKLDLLEIELNLMENGINEEEKEKGKGL